jgi:hypothetical protein
MFAVAFLTGGRQIVPGCELLAVYAPTVDFRLLLMAGTAFHQGKAELMGQLGVTFDASDTFGTVNRSCSEAAVDFNGTRPFFLHHYRILFRAVAAKADLFGGLSGNSRILLLFRALGEELLLKTCIKQGEGT